MNFPKLTAYLDSLNETYGVQQVDVIVTKEGKEIYRHMNGYGDIEKTRPTSADDYYWFFSCTKVMTQVAIMQLIEQGKIHLYDPLSKFLPEFEVMTVYDKDHRAELRTGFQPVAGQEPVHYAKNPIRIIDLMAMEAGFSYNMASPALTEAIEKTGGHGSTREIVSALANEPLYFEPGTHMQYSLCHDVLAAVIEAVSGQRYSRYLKEHVFAPVGAEDLCFLPNEEQKSHLTQIYRYDEETGEMIPTTANGLALTDNFESGGGGMCGSAEAYSKVLAALANGGAATNGNRILKKESVMMFTTAVTCGVDQDDFLQLKKGPYAYGLGVRVKNTMEKGLSPIGEFGWDGAAGAYALVDPYNKISITYLHHILNFETVYQEIHPMVRDLVYEEMGNC